MIVTIVGLGLIGGSMAIDLKRCAFASTIYGVDSNKEHCQKAIELELVDAIKPMDEAIWAADLAILAIPVDAILKTLPEALNHISKNSVITDVGSTKYEIIQSIKDHPKRSRYVAAHPMAGTEYSGPEAAIKNLFQEKVCIICDKEKSDEDAIESVEKMFRALYMEPLYMNAKDHDTHAAYVSHISHISSFILASTVLDKEKSSKTIFDMASGGFASTVRLAKSSPKMWAPIFKQNNENIVEVLETYIKKMEDFKDFIKNDDKEGLLKMMEKANEIKRIIK